MHVPGADPFLFGNLDRRDDIAVTAEDGGVLYLVPACQQGKVQAEHEVDAFLLEDRSTLGVLASIGQAAEANLVARDLLQLLVELP